MSFEKLVETLGYWMAVRLTLTFMGVDFTSAVDDDSAVAIKTYHNDRYVLWHNDQGNSECDLGIREVNYDLTPESRIAKGIVNTFELLCSIRELYEAKITLDQITDSYS